MIIVISIILVFKSFLFTHSRLILQYVIFFKLLYFLFDIEKINLPDTRCLLDEIVSLHCGDKGMARRCTRSPDVLCRTTFS